MRKNAWKIIVLIMVLMMNVPSAFSTSLSGWLNMSTNNSTTEIDGEETFSLRSFNRNFSLNLNRPVTPIVSYNLNLRANLGDMETTDYLAGSDTMTYRRSLEPTLELFIRNNIYDLNAGYRRQEQWSTAHYSNEGRLTTEFYYSRLSVMPKKLPSFSLDLERLKNFDYLSERETDNSTDSYSVSSSYILPSRDMKFGYSIVYSRDESKTPLSILAKSVKTNFSNNYNIGYADSLWNRKINYSAMYLGNYSRNRNRQYYTSTGSQVNLRDNGGGFSAQDTDKQVSLVSNSGLTDANLVTSAGIDLSSNTDNQIGIQILFGKSVDRLYIYVDENISGENALDNKNNWQVYKSSTNSYGSWTAVNISNAKVVYDSLNNKYRYEILFSSSEAAFYFKAVNLVVSSEGNVDVTEIQAYGTDKITDIGAVTDVSKSFSQRINLNAGIRPARKWDFNLSYSIDRADQTPTSMMDSVSGIIENIFSNSLDDENENISSTLTRSYNASARWQTHRLLTSTMNINRNEGFNNTGGIESASNGYSLSMNYVPLPTVDTILTILRSDSFIDKVKESTSDSLLLSANTQLHRDVNMVTDIGYSRSKDIVDDSTTSFSSINGSLDARITRKMSGTVNYGYSNTSGRDSSVSKDFSTSVNYQAGRFINVSGNFDYTNSADNEDVSESIGVDWLPLPKIRLNVNYQHRDSDSDTNKTTSDSVSGYSTIYITRFANIRFSYAYTRADSGTSIQDNQDFNVNLNCRF